jgi:predicted dehydrogenase
MTATLALPNSVTATLQTDLAMPYNVIPSLPQLLLAVDCENGGVELYNYIMPTFYHYIRVVKVEGNKKKTTVCKEYQFKDKAKGEAWWTTYRYQLEAFVDKVKGRTPQTWITAEDSVENMKWIEEIYSKVCRSALSKEESR